MSPGDIDEPRSEPSRIDAEADADDDAVTGAGEDAQPGEPGAVTGAVEPGSGTGADGEAERGTVDADRGTEAGPAEVPGTEPGTDPGERELDPKLAKVAAKAQALAEKPVDDDQDKAPEVTGPPVDPGNRRLAIGVDVGGSGIKVAAVDLDSGELVSVRHRVPTPQPSAPAAVIASIARMIRKIEHEVTLAADVPVGVGFPAVVIRGITRSAANVDPGWIDFDADAAMERVLGRPVHLINDADAAGVAEMRFGAGVGRSGTVFLITLGTGTGSALFYNGMLIPNLELGHMEIRGRDAERRSAAAARVRRGLSWKAWAADLDEHLLAIERLFSPQLFIIGGGVSKRADQFIPRLTVRAEVIPAQLRNDAGIVGAAMAASETELARL